MTITDDMTIAQVIQAKPEAVEILRNFGMHCIGCAVASGESIKDAAQVHGLKIEALMEALNK